MRIELARPMANPDTFIKVNTLFLLIFLKATVKKFLHILLQLNKIKTAFVPQSLVP